MFSAKLRLLRFLYPARFFRLSPSSWFSAKTSYRVIEANLDELGSFGEVFGALEASSNHVEDLEVDELLEELLVFLGQGLNGHFIENKFGELP